MHQKDHDKDDHDKDDIENPEWDDAKFARARPAAEVLPAAVLEAARRKPGRPPAANPKVQVTLRLSPEVLARFRAGGKGWQTRIDEALKRAIR